MKEPQDILSQYQKDLERWKERGAHYKDIQPMTMNELLLVKALLHPTEKAITKDVTRQLIKFMCDRGICTAQEIYSELGYSDKPVMKRIKVFLQHGLLRRESKKFYMPTPRLLEIRNRYLDRICG